MCVADGAIEPHEVQEVLFDVGGVKSTVMSSPFIMYIIQVKSRLYSVTPSQEEDHRVVSRYLSSAMVRANPAILPTLL